MIIDPVTLIVALVTISTPVLLAALGELVVERSGVLNLGVEGMMIMGAVCGFIVAHEAQDYAALHDLPWLGALAPTLAFLAGAAGGAALSVIFAVLTQMLMSNQVATGLALTLFGLGLAALMGVGYEGQPIPDVAKPLPQALRDLPVIGPILLGHDLVTYLAIAAVFATVFVLRHTRTGLILRAVGESHDAAHALGYKVVRIRFAAILFGGAMAGLGGAFLSVVYVENWVQGMTAGAGWIALALVVFASWKPGRVLFGAWLFGGIAALQLRLQAQDFPLILAVTTVLVLVAFAIVVLSGLLALRDRNQPLLMRRLRLAGILAMVALVIRSALWIAAGFTDATVAQVAARLRGFDVALLDASPYLVTILVLVVMSSDRARTALNAPAALGRTFNASG